MIYTVSNKESEIEALLLDLRNIYGDYAFISYIDGEYGIRVQVYRSWVHTFYTTMKEQNIPCIGIVFKNNKLFLDELCDHLIEINDSYLYSISNMNNDDTNCTSLNHFMGAVPTTYYDGNDGWNMSYIRGQYSKSYEDILLKLNFKNIFYTLHVDGSQFINLNGINTGYIFKINNTDVYFDKNNLYGLSLYNAVPTNKIQKYTATNNIVIWTRNTNKWPDRNLPKEVYTAVFDYCILNNKKCYVFQDLIRIDIPEHSNFIEMNTTDRVKNLPNLDKFMELCNNSDIYIGADSGSTEIAALCKTDILVLCSGNLNIKCNCFKYITNREQIINALNNYYNTI